MSVTTVSADGQLREGMHRVRIAGEHPAMWGPMPHHESLNTMKRYALQFGIPVQLDTVHADGSIWRLGFQPNGQEPIDLGQVREAAQRENGGMGAAWAPPQYRQQQQPVAARPHPSAPVRPRSTHREVPGREDDPYRPRHGEAIRQPADNFGPDRKAESWSAPVSGVEEIEIPTAAPAPEQPASRRARRDRERAAQQPASPPPADPPAIQTPSKSTERVGLPPLDSEPQPRLRSWVSKLTPGSIISVGGGLAVAGAGVYFLFQTGVIAL
ncbi:hypothetical protein LG293_16485 (plasmid) [Citricoccus nitrophenolicus]